MNRLAFGLLLLCAVVAALGPLVEARGRAPEQVVRAYLAAVERGELEAALQAVDPPVREAARERVANQLGARYRVHVLALASPSLIDRARGAPGGIGSATLLAEVTPAVGDRWKSTAVVDLVERDGGWYLAEPPFA
jgi:hypothetical protein